MFKYQENSLLMVSSHIIISALQLTSCMYDDEVILFQFFLLLRFLLCFQFLESQCLLLLPGHSGDDIVEGVDDDGAAGDLGWV